MEPIIPMTFTSPPEDLASVCFTLVVLAVRLQYDAIEVIRGGDLAHAERIDLVLRHFIEHLDTMKVTGADREHLERLIRQTLDRYFDGEPSRPTLRLVP